MITDIEIYIKNCSLQTGLNWAVSQLGNFKEVVKMPGQRKYFQFIYLGEEVSLEITENIEEKNYTSFYFSGHRLPWSSDIACARIAHLALNLDIVCSPGLHSKEHEWFQIQNGKETLVSHSTFTF